MTTNAPATNVGLVDEETAAAHPISDIDPIDVWLRWNQPDPWEFAAEGEDTCTAMTDAPEGVDACSYGDGVGYCTLKPGHTANEGLHLCTCTEHSFDDDGKDEDELADYEANTYRTEHGFRVDWYLNAVGQVTSVHFDTYVGAQEWLTANDYQDFTS